MRVGNIAFLKKKIGEWNDVGWAHPRMQGNQALPDRERFWKPIGVDQLKYDSKIPGAIGWNYVVKNGPHVRVDAPATRESLRAALGIGVNGAANFRKGRLNFTLAQQEISIAPGDCGGSGIHPESLKVGL